MDMFIKIDGVPGESKDRKHRGEIELLSFDWGLYNEREAGAGKAVPKDFAFTAHESIASPELFVDCATGKLHRTAVFTARKAPGEGGQAGTEFLKIKLNEVLITSYDTAGTDQDDVPIDSVALSFTKIEYTFTPQDEDGTPGTPVTHSFDFKTRRAT